MTTGPEIRINLAPANGAVTVHADGRRLAHSDRALVLTERGYPPVLYTPRSDGDMAVLTGSSTQTHCPYKGDATYYSLTDEAGGTTDVAWSYETPIDDVAPIADHIAFDDLKVDVALDPAG